MREDDETQNIEKTSRLINLLSFLGFLKFFGGHFGRMASHVLYLKNTHTYRHRQAYFSVALRPSGELNSVIPGDNLENAFS